MNRAGDWNCKSCLHLNFQRRDSCQRCGDLRHGGDYNGSRSGGSSVGLTGPEVWPGDWYCSVPNCGTHNFASRSSCFKCGELKDEVRGTATGGGGGGGFGFDTEISRTRSFGFSGGSRSGWKSGDWVCSRFGCNEHNFASRMECFRCSAPREFNSKSLF